MTVTIRDLMTDPALFGGQFGGESFANWRTLLAAKYGLELSEDERITLEAITGRTDAPQDAFSELWLAVGRRGGKSQVAALIATYEAAFKDHRAKLATGEWATILLVAADRAQARTLLRYVRGLFEHPLLSPLVTRTTESSIELGETRTIIEVGTASYRALRGYTLAAFVADEVAFWFSDGASPDREIIQAIRPALATLGGPLIALSSPYAKRGVLWDTYKRHFGGDSARILVAQAPSRTMNPTLPQAVIDEAMADDPEAARAEYLAEFRSDISSFLDVELIERATRSRPLELPPLEGEQYFGFVDPNGGGKDEFTMGIAHVEGDLTVVDMVRGRNGSPAGIAEEFAAIFKQYRIGAVYGDRYAGRWPADEFRKHGIEYLASELDRSALYLELMARLNSGAVILPPDDKLKRQLGNLERRTHRSGRDTIDHPPGSNDDRANAVAGAVAFSRTRKATAVTKAVIF
ncbi:hypothetical protein SOQ14_12030 [Erythrobacter sp. T5W1-R]|uniref:hypothetical protein n=1 Tax=Erythrobacter sp. T5W1-R TaxID=3101752 RepID=UPI002AFFCD9F|nr:hypothetical protein [Erythrobacter sp. T5W1-R]MEA1619646.1 hypothetical protein [Erythrobacter sp. T5W1-R]